MIKKTFPSSESGEAGNAKIEVIDPETDMATINDVWAYNFGQVFGVPVKVHFSYFLLLQVQVYAAFFTFYSLKFALFIFILYGPILLAILMMVSVAQDRKGQQTIVSSRLVSSCAEKKSVVLCCRADIGTVMHAPTHDHGLLPINPYLVLSHSLNSLTFLFQIQQQHECGRALMTKKLGGRIESILLWPLGGFSVCGATNGGAGDDILVALAGPFTHLIQGGLWLAVFSIFRGEFHNWTDAVDLKLLTDRGVVYFIANLAAQATMMNAFLFGINLLMPAYPMDGGRILSSFLHMTDMLDVPTTAMVTGITGTIFGGILAIQGLVYTIFGASTSYGILQLLIGGFAVNSSVALMRMTGKGLVNQHPLFSRECYRMHTEVDHSDVVALADVELT